MGICLNIPELLIKLITSPNSLTFWVFINKIYSMAIALDKTLKGKFPGSKRYDQMTFSSLIKFKIMRSKFVPLSVISNIQTNILLLYLPGVVLFLELVQFQNKPENLSNHLKGSYSSDELIILN